MGPLWFQKGNNNIRILMELDGNAGDGGDALGKSPFSPNPSPSLLQAGDIICPAAQLTPQVLSDLLIPSFPWLITHL